MIAKTIGFIIALLSAGDALASVSRDELVTHQMVHLGQGMLGVLFGIAVILLGISGIDRKSVKSEKRSDSTSATE